MGTVYQAEDPLLKRKLAIKVVRAVGEERDLALERFKREAEVSAQLNHPNIVTIYDVGEEPKVGPFLAMELVEGHSLGKHIRDGTLEVETCFGILIQSMRALRAAHRHAIIHRDVKPDNILVGEDGRVKLMDFGIAKTMAPRLTSSGEFLGSPAYSAPELLKGAEPTPSSDRYAFAVTAFELLTGQLPHPGANVAAVITHVLHEHPVIPPGMPGDVGNVFRKGLAPDPDERYETLVEFLTSLVDVYPIEPAVRDRINELFHRDDHAGDIVPLRRRARTSASNSQDPTASGSFSLRGTSSGIRATGGRATPVRSVPAYTLPSGPKIELEDGPAPSPFGSAPPRLEPPGHRKPQKESSIQPKTLIWWIIFVLIGGQVFWYLYAQMHKP